MANRVVFAVAGSGKTSTIINQIQADSRCLINTYTDNNTRHLQKKVIAKFGNIPTGVRILSYFTFLYSFCYRPILGAIEKTPSKGMNFTRTLPMKCARARKTERAHWWDDENRLFANRLAKLILNYFSKSEVIDRIEHFFDFVCIDEVQDFAANDFNFICSLIKAEVEFLLVGDFFQHTFDTSRDGSTNMNLYNDYDKYREKLKKRGFEVKTDVLTHSHRCSPSVCEFVNDNLGIQIESHRDDTVEVKLLEDKDEINAIVGDCNVVKLFYSKCRNYKGFTDNWGNTKGLDDFQDVCVVLNPNSYEAFTNNWLSELAPTTKNKLYVACTRAKGNLYFVTEAAIKQFKIKG